MVRTIVLTILIVIGAAIGGYALWNTSQSDGEAVATACGGAAATACASATDAGCGSCPSAGTADATTADATGCASEMKTADAGCEGCPSKATCEDAEECVGDADCTCVSDADCTCEGECTCEVTCDGDPANCTEEMKAACGEIEAAPACGSAESCGGGRCGSGASSADAS